MPDYGADGREAIITSGLTKGPYTSADGTTSEAEFYFVSIDGQSTVTKTGGKKIRYAMKPENLRPIHPEGWRVISWEECTIWRPKDETPPR
jgi:hypothetical protein